jgi:hypothetical protein
MAIYLRDLLRDPKLLDSTPGQQKCCHCGVVLQETITGKRQTPAGDACSDCFYEELGQEVEHHPITSAGIRRS